MTVGDPWPPGASLTLGVVTSDDPGQRGLRVFNVLRGEASQVRSTPSGDVGTVFSGQGIEMVWMSKLAEPIDPDWFSSDEVDLILVVLGQLKFEFASPGQPRASPTAC